MRTKHRFAAAMALATALVLPRFALAEGLSASQALSRAAAANPTLRASLDDVKAAHLSTEAEVGARDPMLDATLQGGYDENATGATTVNGSTSVTSKVSVSYTTDIGTKLEVGTSVDMGWHPDARGAVNAAPAVTPLAFASARQPLLKGSSTTVNRAQIVDAELGAKQAELDHAALASSTALDVLTAYWELWYADRAVAVQEAAREEAAKELADANAKVDVLGTGTPLDALQFSTSLASIEDALAQAKATRVTRAIALGRLLGMSAKDAQSLEATDALPGSPEFPDEASLIARALDHSPDLASLKVGLDKAKLAVDRAADADQPELDLFASASAGVRFDTIGSDYLFEGGRPTFSVLGGLELSLPLGGGRASSDRARATVELNAAQDRYQARVDQIVADVASKRVEATSADSSIALATKTLETAKKLAQAERDRMTLGTGNAADVVKAEEQVREAELRVLRAQVNAITSGYALEDTSGVLLDGIGSALKPQDGADKTNSSKSGS